MLTAQKRKERKTGGSYSNYFKMKKLYLLLFLFFICRDLAAQDLGAIGKEKPFKISGSLSANQMLYTADGIPNRRPPWNYFLTGSLNIGLYGWTVPLSYMISNQNSQFQQPFNQYGVTPYYKWIKLYAGYNSMTFSPYTLNGHIFLGGGVQLSPGILRFSAMYGRLNKAIEEDLHINARYDSLSSTTLFDTLASNRIPYYQRMGMGFKIGVEKNNNALHFVFFTAKDDPNSIRTPIRQQVQPAENTVMSLIASKSITKRLTLSAEYAASAYTRDINAPKAYVNFNNTLFPAYPFYKGRTSSSFNNAYNARILYNGEGFSLGAAYEHIDPEYRTLGTYFFNNDLENYTLNGSKRFLQGKLNLAANVGIQQNNLRGDKLSKMNRQIGSVNISYAPSAKWNISAGYSNFQTFTRVRSQFDRINNVDTLQLNNLDFVQIGQSVNSNISYLIGNPDNKNIKNAVSLMLTFQDVSNAGSNNQRVATGTQFYNGVASFNRSLTPQALNMTFSWNTNVNELGSSRSILLGPTVTISKALLEKKLKLTTSTSWTNSINNGKKVNDIMNLRFGGTYTVKKKHNFNLTASLIHRENNRSETRQPNFTEYTANMGYGYTF